MVSIDGKQRAVALSEELRERIKAVQEASPYRITTQSIIERGIILATDELLALFAPKGKRP